MAPMARSLVLNATLEPLCVVAERRAVVLVLDRKAEVVHDTGSVLRSARLEVVVPSVIRLCNYVRVPHRWRPPLNRRSVFARDDHCCQYCGGPAESIDHVIPRSRGGSHTWENVVAACRPCNIRKRDRLLGETSMRLMRRPAMPRGLSWMALSLGPVPDSWTPYLLPAA
jgi:5-methylcytosine-specific restriction endonuclease McrA